jgi:hypothetical protein
MRRERDGSNALQTSVCRLGAQRKDSSATARAVVRDLSVSAYRLLAEQ